MTIHQIIGEYEDHGIINAWPRSGRPSVFDNQDKQHLVQVIKKDHTAPLNQITSEIQSAQKLSTILQFLTSAHLFSKTADYFLTFTGSFDSPTSTL